MTDGVDARRVVALLVIVLAASVVASFGFNALTTNPLVPEATLTIADAPEPAKLNESGPSPMLTVTHDGGESIPLSDLEVVVGSRADGLTFGAASGWSVAVSGVTYEVRLNGATIGHDDAFGAGDVMTVRKTEGTLGVAGFEALVRVFHRPSNTAIARRTVAIR